MGWHRHCRFRSNETIAAHKNQFNYFDIVMEFLQNGTAFSIQCHVIRHCLMQQLRQNATEPLIIQTQIPLKIISHFICLPNKHTIIFQVDGHNQNNMNCTTNIASQTEWFIFLWHLPFVHFNIIIRTVLKRTRTEVAVRMRFSPQNHCETFER